MKTKFDMQGVYGTPFSEEDKARIKRVLEERPDVLGAEFIQFSNGQYRFLVTFIEEP